MGWISEGKGRFQRWAWFAMPWLVATAGCSEGPTRNSHGSHEPLAQVGQAVSTCNGSSVVVDADATSGFTTIESALSCLGRRKLDAAVDVYVAPGVYQPFLNAGETAPLVIDHPEASRITLRGETPLEVPLSAFNDKWPVCCSGETCAAAHCSNASNPVSYYAFKYNLANADWLNVKARLQASAGEAYALIRRTRPLATNDGLNHAIHQGVWKIDINETLATSNRLVVHLKYRPQDPDSGVPSGLGALPSPLDAEFSATTPPMAAILTTVVKFTCSAGIDVDASTLKELKNLAVVGDYDSARQPGLCLAEKRRKDPATLEWSQNFAGINVQRGGGVNLSYVGVSSMDGQGVSVYPSSWVVAHRTAASGNERRGFYPTFTGGAELSETIASGNHTDGYVADHTAYAKLAATLAIGNNENGYNTMFGAALVIRDSTSSHNGQPPTGNTDALGSGFASKGGSKIWFETSTTSSDAYRNESIGLLSELGGNVRAAWLKLQENDAARTPEPLGIRFDLGSTYSLDASVANHDGEDIDDATAVVPAPTPPAPRPFFTNKRLYAPTRTATASEFGASPEVTINPDPEWTGARSLHDFFNVPGPHSIAGKRLSLGDATSPRQNYLTVKLGAGVFPYAGNPIVITHPDAPRVKIRGESCAVRVASTMAPLNNCAPDPVPEELIDCREVKLELSDNDCTEIKVGEFFAFRDTDEDSAGHPHWVHRGVWQVSAINVNGNPNRLKLRNFSGDDIEGVNAVDQSGNGLVARVMRTILYFPDPVPGIVVDGTTLGSLEHVVLVGSELPLVPTVPNSPWNNLTSRWITIAPPLPTPNHSQCNALGYTSETLFADKSGLKIQNCGHAYYDQVAATGFVHSGIRVTKNSTLLPWPYTDGYLSGQLFASANGTHGILATKDSTIWAKGSVASANLGSGYYASDGGALSLALSSSTANKAHGFEVRSNGYIEAGESAAVSNLQNGVLVSAARFTASQGSEPQLLGAAAVFAENGTNGCWLEAGAYAALNGAWSIGHDGTTSGTGAGIHVAGQSKCRCRSVTLQSNRVPLKSKDASIVIAGDAVCIDNDGPWVVDPGAVIDGTCTTP